MSPSIHSLSYSLVMRWSHSQHWMHKQIHTHYDTKPVIQSQKKSSEASLASWRWKSKKSFPPYFSDATPMPLQWFPICPGKEEVLKGEISPTALGVSQLRIWPVFTNIFLATGHSNRGYWEWGWGKGSSEVSFRFFAVISLLFTLWFFFFFALGSCWYFAFILIIDASCPVSKSTHTPALCQICSRNIQEPLLECELLTCFIPLHIPST